MPEGLEGPAQVAPAGKLLQPGRVERGTIPGDAQLLRTCSIGSRSTAITPPPRGTSLARSDPVRQHVCGPICYTPRREPRLKKYVVLAGNIGVGKTTLVALMCECWAGNPTSSRWPRTPTW